MTKADGSFQKNHYDAEGLRAEMEENGQLVKFLYNEDREAVAEEESDGNVIRYIRGLGLIYYLRARYYNPVIAGFTQEDTYYGDGLNLYTYCQNNPILYHDPTGHGTKENSPYSRNEQQYIDVGADPDTARLAAQCYPDAKSKQDLYNKYKKQGYSAQDAKKLANREIIHGEEATKKYIKDNNVKKSGPDYTATSPRDNVNTDWRTQERVNAQRNAGAGKGNESGNKSDSTSNYYNPDGSPIWPPNRGFDGNPTKVTLEPGTLIDRYGYDGGTFVSPKGIPYTERSLPIGTDQKPYTVFEVVKPVEVQAGKIAPWFGEKGGGIQYEFSQKISDLLQQGILRKVQN